MYVSVTTTTIDQTVPVYLALPTQFGTDRLVYVQQILILLGGTVSLALRMEDGMVLSVPVQVDFSLSEVSV